MQKVGAAINFFDIDSINRVPNASVEFNKQCTIISIIYYNFPEISEKELLIFNYISEMHKTDKQRKVPENDTEEAKEKALKALIQLNFYPKGYSKYILDYLKNGYIDRANFEIDFRKEENEAIKNTTINLLHECWKLVRNNFYTTQEDLVEKFKKSLKCNYQNLPLREIYQVKDFLIKIEGSQQDVEIEGIWNDSIKNFGTHASDLIELDDFEFRWLPQEQVNKINKLILKKLPTLSIKR